ncbi:class II aldolase/adducin family protein [Cellulomonas persica]|uniref:Class II aldolase/adducin family protein n=1 Tax=Cellulomonas persica TaxID=76861 RepID=A0A510UQX7_9CELL|nr:class II aldolase/adducin family protein [Cellulomonas persica]GEK17062.1 class II aldolase/adducin family protein [Cellulomonas persica]
MTTQTLTTSTATDSTPTAKDLDQQRATIRRDLAATLRWFGAHGYQFGLAGHATVRDPGPQERYWVNPAGLPFAAVTEDDLVLVDADGAVVEGRHSAAGYQSQVEVHRARPDLAAGFHVHAPYIFAWSSAGGLLDPITTDAAWLAPVQALRESFDQPITEAIGPTARVLIQRAHGAATFGATIAEAAYWFVAVERAAHAQLVAEAAGRVRLVDDAVLATWQLTPASAHAQFQALLDHFVAGEDARR